MYNLLVALQRKLTNLTGSNKSILQLRLFGEQDLDIHQLDFLNGKSSFYYFQQLLSGKNLIHLIDELDPRNQQVNVQSQRLKQIFRKNQFIIDERGSQDLYIGYPFVHGSLNDGTPVRCPLLFFPVSLVLLEGKWMLQSRSIPKVYFNKSFLLAYAHYNQCQLDETLVDYNWEDLPEEPRVFLTHLYQLLKSSSIAVQFNQALFEEKLQTFESYKKEEFQILYAPGIIKLIPEAVLGIYPQAGSYLNEDYDCLINNPPAADLESFFISKNGFEHKQKEEKLFTPLSIDGSQEKAIEIIKKGNSIVVQGPPGTGKSQLIANIISDYVANGKKVLLSCNKRVALDVVHARLTEIGLGAFVSLIHDHKNDRKTVYGQIATQIDTIDQYQQENNGLDTVFLERNFIQISRKIDQLTQQLENFRTALFDTSIAGISVKELYLTSKASSESYHLMDDYKALKPTDLSKYATQLRRWLRYAKQFEHNDYVWKNRVSLSHTSFSDLPIYRDTISKIAIANQEVRSYCESQGLSILSLADFKDLLGHIPCLLDLEQRITSEADLHVIKTQIQKRKLKRLFEKVVFDLKRVLPLERYLGNDDSKMLISECESHLLKLNNFFVELSWRFFGKKSTNILKALKDHHLAINRSGLIELKQLLVNRIKLNELIAELEKCGFVSLSVPLNFNEFEAWIHEKWLLMNSLDQCCQLGDTEEILLKRWLKGTNSVALFSSSVKAWVQVCQNMANAASLASPFLHLKQLDMLQSNDKAQQLVDVLTRDIDGLSEYDRLTEEWTNVEKKLAMDLLDNSSHLDSEDAKVALFENSLRLRWVAHIEGIYPDLRMVSTAKIQDIEEELQQLIKEKQSLSSQVVKLKAKEFTYKDLAFNRLKNRVTYRDLYHEVTKKKRIVSVRKLIEKFQNEIFDLVPCWLASPETISSIFSLESIFDIVIFDEASQCFVEEAIPTICRGRQVLIVGDSQQLPPNDLYLPRWEEEVENTDLQVDSLLDLGVRYLPQVMLTGHYRSRFLSLIQFSNIHFYKNKLSLIPFKEDMNSKVPAINYKKVNGIWENNVNVIEAQEVAFWVHNYVEKFPHLSIGVITFNYKQQKLIQDLIDERFSLGDLVLPNSLFVKNIENVQGDERDIIIFSIGYAPDSKGKFIMNFGSLNLDGGQNRLNVAITRAKEKIIVVTSINPNQLQVSDAKNIGPKLLKEFLIYALQISEGLAQNHFNAETVKSETNFITLAAKLSNELTVKLPFADLVVIKNASYDALILTDDNAYFQSLSTKEAHAYIPNILALKNWPVKREYSRNWWKSI